MFWEQFDVAVHSKSGIMDMEKLVYLQHTYKRGSTKQAIKGFSRSGDYYSEKIKYLSDRPCLIHQAHVRMIVDAPPLKDKSRKELRRLHNVVQQHLRVLRSLGHNPPGPFIISFLELKLDATTMFKWQRHSEASTDNPHYDDLLKFLNLRTQASKSSSDPARKARKLEPWTPYTQKHPFAKPIAFSPVIAINCAACKREKHPLYACTKFRALDHDNMSMVKGNNWIACTQGIM